jgi:hypothetical protein
VLQLAEEQACTVLLCTTDRRVAEWIGWTCKPASAKGEPFLWVRMAFSAKSAVSGPNWTNTPDTRCVSAKACKLSRLIGGVRCSGGVLQTSLAPMKRHTSERKRRE